ncbi:uncharacterized protein (UPF0261 family) [Devosia sp. UYZn731]|uniref:hypothetical protein n=1 Tax=Devosia sp. UYZn731 TaxID=3156345 RepID=UPI00339B538A
MSHTKTNQGHRGCSLLWTVDGETADAGLLNAVIDLTTTEVPDMLIGRFLPQPKIGFD